MSRAILAMMFLSSTSAFGQVYDPGEQIQEALSLQVTEDGLEVIEVVAAQLVPELLGEDVIDIGDSIDVGIVTLDNLAIGVAVNDVNLSPVEGATPPTSFLRIDVDATLLLNDESNPYSIYALFGACNGDAWAEIDASITLEIFLSVRIDPATQERVFDAAVDMPGDGIAIRSTRFFGECSTVGNIVGGLAGGLVGLVQQPIEDQLVELEPTIEEALNQARFVDTLDLLGAELSIAIEPKQVLIEDDGLSLIYSARADTAQAACIEPYDPEGSVRTDTPLPGVGDNPRGTQVAAMLSDDMVSQILYAAFRSGVLCFTLDENSEDISLPIALDSSLLGLLGGEGYTEVIGDETKPLVIQTLPRAVPTVDFDGRNDVDVQVRELGLGFYTELDYRMARAVGLDIEVDAGVNLGFDGTTGEIEVDVALDPSDLQFRVVDDVIVKGSEAAIEDGVAGLLDTLLPTLLGDALEGLVFAIPSFSGLGVTDLEARVAGSGDWLAVDLEVGPVTYGDPSGAGCDSEGGGCDGGGCEGGCEGSSCTTARLNLGGWLVFLLPFWALRRRR